MAKKGTDTQPGIKIIAKHKKAWFDYFVEEK